MSTFRNVFAAVAMVLFVGLAIASSPAMADEVEANGTIMSEFEIVKDAMVVNHNAS